MRIIVPKPESLFAWGSPERKIYEALTQEGEITNTRITRGLCVGRHAAAIGRIRVAIRPHGLDIAGRDLSAGVRAYRIAVADQNRKAA